MKTTKIVTHSVPFGTLVQSTNNLYEHAEIQQLIEQGYKIVNISTCSLKNSNAIWHLCTTYHLEKDN